MHSIFLLEHIFVVFPDFNSWMTVPPTQCFNTKHSAVPSLYYKQLFLWIGDQATYSKVNTIYIFHRKVQDYWMPGHMTRKIHHVIDWYHRSFFLGTFHRDLYTDHEPSGSGNFTSSRSISWFMRITVTQLSVIENL